MVAINLTNITQVQFTTWLAMLYVARNDMEAESHVVSLAELNELSGYKQHDRKYLKEAMIKFCSTALEFNTLGKSKKDYGGKVTALLAAADFDETPGSVRFYFSPVLKKIIKDSEMFANLSLALVRRMDTKSGLALYRLCNDYRGVQTTPLIPLKELRGIIGVEEKAYPLFKVLNQDILKPACEQVNEKTDIHIEPHFVKGAHGKVLGVKFTIKEQIMPLMVAPTRIGDRVHIEKQKSKFDNPYCNFINLHQVETEKDRINSKLDVPGSALTMEDTANLQYLREMERSL